MKLNNILKCGIVGTFLAMTSCSEFTDITPTSVNMLKTTSDIEMLFNYTYMGFTCSDMIDLMADCPYLESDVPSTINMQPKSRLGIILSYDESQYDSYARMTYSDEEYEFFYRIVGTMANPALQSIEDADGDEFSKRKVKAEAYCLRAWGEFLAVNKYAKGYNPATAAKTPGVPYVLEDFDIQQPTVKSTAEEVYQKALADVNSALALNALPVEPVNKCRFGLGAAYALKAYLLANMQRWEEAGQAATEALNVNGGLIDYFSPEYTKVTYGFVEENEYLLLDRPRLSCVEDYFTTDGIIMGPVTKEFYASLEAGSYVTSRINSYEMMFDYLNPDVSLEMIGISAPMFLLDFDFGWNYYGFKTSQMYLLRAEANIHQGKIAEAMADIDLLRQNRIDPDVFAPSNVMTAAEAIASLKQTSRAENVFSCYNFINQKRWNQVEGWEDTISHEYGGEVFTLAPDSKMWVFPFPMNVLENNPNITQNANE